MSHEDDDVVFVEEEDGSDALKKLREKLKNCTKEKEEYLAGWQRSKADLINANRIAREDHLRGRASAHEELIADLIPVLDGFSMAMANKEVWEKVDPVWRTGVEYISKELTKVLEEYGLSEINSESETFDPAIHHSVEVVATDKKAQDDHIARVIQKGYTLNGSVLRPATVSVYRLDN